MGFEINVTTQDGVTHSKAYFRINAVQLDYINKVCKITLGAWSSKVARDDDKVNISGIVGKDIPISAKFIARNQVVSGVHKALLKTPEDAEEKNDFDDYFALSKQNSAGTNLVDLCYTYVKEQLVARGLSAEDITDVDPD